MMSRTRGCSNTVISCKNLYCNVVHKLKLISIHRYNYRMHVQEERAPMSVFWRWYIYALHGYATEIMFTATWEFVFNLNWKLMGNTSIWIMPIYGVSGLVCEQIYIHCSKRKMPLFLRGFVYLIWTYFWEFSTGFVLRQFDLCPWDYTHYDADVMGLITLEYAPLWYILGIIIDRFVLQYTRKLYWGPTHVDFTVNDKTE